MMMINTGDGAPLTNAALIAQAASAEMYCQLTNSWILFSNKETVAQGEKRAAGLQQNLANSVRRLPYWN